MNPSRSTATLAWFGLLLATSLSVPDARAMLLETGSFDGDGSGARAITGVGFTPEVVLMRTLGSGTSVRVRTTTLTAGTKQLSLNQAPVIGVITSLDADGFTVGSGVNALGASVHWIAFGETDEGFAVGSYLGDGALSSVDISDTSTSPDFQASYLILMSDAVTTSVQRFENGGSGSSQLFGFTGPIFSGGDVVDLTATGFTVSTGIRTNDDGVAYHYVAWAEREGTAVDTYTGDGIPGDQLVALPFLAKFVSVSRLNCCVQSRLRFDSQDPDVSSFYTSATETSDAIKSFTASGFSLGDSADTGSAQSHWFVAFGSAPSPIPALSRGGLAFLVVAIAALALRTSHRS